MPIDNFNETNSGATLRQVQRLYSVLGHFPHAHLLAMEVAGTHDSFGVVNQGSDDKDLPYGLEMIFDIKCDQIDTHYDVKGNGYLRVNIGAFVDALEISKTMWGRTDRRYEEVALRASALLSMPIGGGALVRPYKAMDRKDFSLA